MHPIPLPNSRVQTTDLRGRVSDIDNRSVVKRAAIMFLQLIADSSIRPIYAVSLRSNTLRPSSDEDRTLCSAFIAYSYPLRTLYDVLTPPSTPRQTFPRLPPLPTCRRKFAINCSIHLFASFSVLLDSASALPLIRNRLRRAIDCKFGGRQHVEIQRIRAGI